MMMASRNTVYTRRSLRLHSFCDLVGLQAVGAYLNADYPPVHAGSDSLEVRKPSATGHVVRMTDRVAADWFLAADLANLCHLPSLSAVLKSDTIYPKKVNGATDG
jgi:hypothetical protein